MKRYSIFHPLFMSFYSKDLYRDVGRNWKGVAFGYLLMLLAICWIPLTYQVHVLVNDAIDHEAPKVISQFPAISITNGVVSVDKPMPYYFTDPNTKKPFVIIDTSGQVTSLDNTDAVVLLTKNKLIMKKSAAETQVYDLSSVKEFRIDQLTVNNWLLAFETWFPIMLYPFAVIFSFAYRIIQVLIYALIGMIMANILKTEIDYQRLVRLSVIAVTPAVLVNNIVWLTGAHVPFFGLICFGIAMGYLFFGIKSYKEAVGEGA